MQCDAVRFVLCCVQLFVTPWTVACQVPLFLELTRQEYLSGLSFPTPGDPSDPGIEPISPALASRFFTTSATWEAPINWLYSNIKQKVKKIKFFGGTEKKKRGNIFKKIAITHVSVW